MLEQEAGCLPQKLTLCQSAKKIFNIYTPCKNKSNNGFVVFQKQQFCEISCAKLFLSMSVQSIYKAKLD